MKEGQQGTPLLTHPSSHRISSPVRPLHSRSSNIATSVAFSSLTESPAVACRPTDRRATPESTPAHLDRAFPPARDASTESEHSTECAQ